MSKVTNWGYTVTDADSLESMLTVKEFESITGGKYEGDERTEPNIKAACAAVRNYCNWHVSPSHECVLSDTFFSRRVTCNGSTVLIQLPAKFVSAVDSVTIGETAYTTFIFETNGLVKVYGVNLCGLKEYSPVSVEYTAGFDNGSIDGLKELIAHRVTHALASSGGVQSETAGGVSITYSANWINSARSTALADDNKEVLAPYRVQGVF